MSCAFFAFCLSFSFCWPWVCWLWDARSCWCSCFDLRAGRTLQNRRILLFWSISQTFKNARFCKIVHWLSVIWSAQRHVGLISHVNGPSGILSHSQWASAPADGQKHLAMGKGTLPVGKSLLPIGKSLLPMSTYPLAMGKSTLPIGKCPLLAR